MTVTASCAPPAPASSMPHLDARSHVTNPRRVSFLPHLTKGQTKARDTGIQFLFLAEFAFSSPASPSARGWRWTRATPEGASPPEAKGLSDRQGPLGWRPPFPRGQQVMSQDSKCQLTSGVLNSPWGWRVVDSCPSSRRGHVCGPAMCLCPSLLSGQKESPC